MRLPVNQVILWSGLTLMGVGSVMTYLSSEQWLPSGWPLEVLSLGGCCLFVCRLTLLSVTVRCRRCGFRLFWRAISTRVPGGGLHWFFTASACSACGYGEPKPN
jgi:ribosomal protein L37E